VDGGCAGFFRILRRTGGDGLRHLWGAR
jgi:hypothetical protein